MSNRHSLKKPKYEPFLHLDVLICNVEHFYLFLDEKDHNTIPIDV